MSITIGEKLELFYLALNSTALVDIPLTLDLVNDLESHVPLTDKGEDPEVVSEIVKDCRKKASSLIRGPFTETLRVLTSSCRKRLAAKAALDKDSAAQHGQRHLNCLVELVGTWSNIVSQVTVECDYAMSRDMVTSILSPLYPRMIEACFECFTAFKQDKELDKMTKNLLTLPHKDLSLNTVDGLVSQTAQMREILHQHYTFLHDSFAGYVESASPLPSPTKDKIPPAQQYINGMLLANAEEISRWRELEAIYISLELGYLSRAVLEAFLDTSILEIEDFCYIPQAVEDVFFLLNKCAERALTTGSESCVFSVANKVVELLNSNEEHEDSHTHALLYLVTTSRDTYRHCVEEECIFSSELVDRVMQNIEDSRLGITHNKVSSTGLAGSDNENNLMKTPGKVTPSSSVPNSRPITPVNTDGGKNNSGGGGASSSGANSALLVTPPRTNTPLLSALATNLEGSGIKSLLSDAAVTGVSQVNSWLVGFASPYMTAEEQKGMGDLLNSTTKGIAYNGNSNSNSGSGNGEGSGDSVSSDRSNSPAPSLLSRPPLPGGNSNSFTNNTAGSSHGSTSFLSAMFSTPLGKQQDKLSGRSSHGSDAGSSGSTGKMLKNSSNSPAGVPQTMDEFLLNALQCDDEEEDGHTSSDTMGSGSSHHGSSSGSLLNSSMHNKNSFHAGPPLVDDDWIIQMNTLSTIVTCVHNLHTTYVQHMNHLNSRYRSRQADGSDEVVVPAVSSSLTIVLQELTQIERKYRSFLDAEITHYTMSRIYRKYIQSELTAFCNLSFDISGQEMEDRYNDNRLLILLKRTVGPVEVIFREEPSPEEGEKSPTVGTSSKKIKDRVVLMPYFQSKCVCTLSVNAFHRILCELCTLIATFVMDELVNTKMFTEWGAMLLYQEVSMCMQYIEGLIDSIQNVVTLKQTYEKLVMTLKILSLDHPRYLLSYRIDGKLFDETSVRKIFTRRSDLNMEAKDAASKVKITLV